MIELYDNLILHPKFLDDAQLFLTLNKEIEWEQKYIKRYGGTIPIPRLTSWYGEKAYTYSGIENKVKPFTSTIDNIRKEIENYYEIKLNSCLANLYLTGKDSVDWHSDDEKELGSNPVIASISFGETRIFSIRDIENEELKYEIPLDNGDLVIMMENFQSKYQHAILKDKKITKPRINLTFRHIV